jgi:hypothetical protein
MLAVSRKCGGTECSLFYTFLLKMTDIESSSLDQVRSSPSLEAGEMEGKRKGQSVVHVLVRSCYCILRLTPLGEAFPEQDK